jgi:hypothetical protein
MGNVENTAVNELIARGSGARRPAGDAMRHGRARSGRMPVSAPFETTMPMPYPLEARQALDAPETPGAPGALGPEDGRAWTPPADGQRLDPRQLYQQMHQPERERAVPTFRMRRRSEVRTVVRRLVLPSALVVSAGIVVGAYVALGGDAGKPHELAAAALVAAPAAVPAVVQPAPPAPAAPPAPSEPAPAAATSDAPAAQAAPVLVDVRIDSVPSGATVTLVDRGRNQLVGDTPIDTAVDPSREYDLVFTYADRPPHVEHLDARTVRRVSAVLAPHDSGARLAGSAPRRPERGDRGDRAGRAAGGAAGGSRSARAHGQASAGEGTLMISSKPPCEIVIDGRPTGLFTPQRSIALSAGSHQVTLRNSEKSIRKTLSVQIEANATEKVIEDLMQ